MEFFDTGLIVALAIAVIGTLHRIVSWGDTGSSSLSEHEYSGKPLWQRFAVFVSETLILTRTLRTGRLRWLAHCLVFFGFMGLLLFHAMDETITVAHVPDYEPTLDPWQFLRNLFGLMTLIGVGLMIYRRFASARLFAITRFQDWAALLVICGIIVSGFFLEASKLISPAVYDRMVEEYGDVEEARDIIALKAFWAHEYGLVFAEKLPFDQETLSLGADLNDENCSTCHSDTATAFVSRSLATVMKPIAPAMNISRADTVFWYVHILFCLVALAALPFGKWFHPISTPITMALRQGRRDGDPESSSVKRNAGMAACTRCGECSLRCSVAPSAVVLHNENLLPSEKLASLKEWKSGTLPSLSGFAEGSRLCTECLKCTDICPAGINLQDIWMQSKPEIERTVPNPDYVIRQMDHEQWVAAYGQGDIPPSMAGLADNAESFWSCVQCTTCTSVCPVVAVSEDPSSDLDLTPQQIMNLLRMGLKDQTLGARMVWSCTTCYKCQEHCPQNIRVADILFELRNTVATRHRNGGDK